MDDKNAIFPTLPKAPEYAFAEPTVPAACAAADPVVSPVI
jgi:hypothetical protein